MSTTDPTIRRMDKRTRQTKVQRLRRLLRPRPPAEDLRTASRNQSVHRPQSSVQPSSLTINAPACGYWKLVLDNAFQESTKTVVARIVRGVGRVSITRHGTSPVTIGFFCSLKANSSRYAGRHSPLSFVSSLLHKTCILQKSNTRAIQASISICVKAPKPVRLSAATSEQIGSSGGCAPGLRTGSTLASRSCSASGSRTISRSRLREFRVRADTLFAFRVYIKRSTGQRADRKADLVVGVETGHDHAREFAGAVRTD